MRAKWNKTEIKELFDTIEKNNKKNLPAIYSFDEYSRKTGRNKFSIRNFYYAFLKELRINKKLSNELEIDITKHTVQDFKHFNKLEEISLINKINKYRNQGLSVRKSCLNLSNGDIRKMLRLQNKYYSLNLQKTKNLLSDKKTLNRPTPGVKVLRFQKNIEKKRKLSDEEISSLFLGLIKLVKENEQQKIQETYRKSERNKREFLVLHEDQSNEISILKNTINGLKQKISFLNQKLIQYRINYLESFKPVNKNNI